MGRYLSRQYKKQLRLMHESRVWGDGGHKYLKRIHRLAEGTASKTILDYGCGSGTVAPNLHNVTIFEYDPGVTGKDKAPQPADMVVCTDVLEHIEPDYLDRVMQHIWELATKAAFFVVATRDAHSTLPDGRNAHLMVRSGQWWVQKLRDQGWKLRIDEMTRGELVVSAIK